MRYKTLGTLPDNVMNDHHHSLAIGLGVFLGEILTWIADAWQYVDKGVVYATHAVLLGVAIIAWRKARK